MHESTIKINSKLLYKMVLYIIVAMIIGFSFAGCENEGYKGKTYNIITYNDLIKALNDRGYSVEELKSSNNIESKSIFSINARNVSIGSESISIYEFKNSEVANLESKSISKDGYSVGNKKINWSKTPHFFQKGNLIVSYIGDDEKIFFDLSVILNKSITVDKGNTDVIENSNTK